MSSFGEDSMRKLEDQLDKKDQPKQRVVGFEQGSKPVAVPSRRDSRDMGFSDFSTSPKVSALSSSPGVASTSYGKSSSLGKSGNFDKFMQQLKSSPSPSQGTGAELMAAAATANKQAKQQQPKQQQQPTLPSQGEFEKKPATTKAERRAIQEAQRAAKAAGLKVDPKTQSGPKAAPPAAAKPPTVKPVVGVPHDDPKKAKQSKKVSVLRTQSQKQVSLFSHLPQYERELSLSSGLTFGQTDIHPEIIKLGLKFADGIITGGVGRTVAMLRAFKIVIHEFVNPSDDNFSRVLLKRVNESVDFLSKCRPLSIPMGNAIRYVKEIVAHVPSTSSDPKKILLKSIDDYTTERITAADIAIWGLADGKIKDGDVLLTYARSHVVEQSFIYAHSIGKRFSVIIVDSKPHFEGKKLLRTLSEKGIPCTYIHFNALSYQMKHVTKIFIGAAAMFSNGNILSRCGTASVCMMARAYNRPVIVCCETFKFSERVLLDSICFNELGDPDDLIKETDSSEATSAISDWRDTRGLLLLNLVYDNTPMEFINMVITEVGIIPPTSVPAVIRELTESKEKGEVIGRYDNRVRH